MKLFHAFICVVFCFFSSLLQAETITELTTAWPSNVGPLNPHLYSPNQMFAQSMVYEPLVKYQSDGSVKPWLATDWRHSEDGKEWFFTIR